MLKASNGITNLHALAGPWGKYSLEERKLFLSMMESCEIAFMIEDDKENPKYLIPEFLSEEKSHTIEEHWSETKDGELFLKYIYPFFHSAFMTRFISKAGRLAQNFDRIWKRGIWITHQGTDALIEAFPRQHYISIRVKGNARRELLGG